MTYQNQRKIYGQTLVEIAKENKNIVVLDADLYKSTMGCLFEEAFPERHFEMGIAEQNMASFAAGLSLSGKIPFINSFAVFATGRAYDQIRQSICIGKLNVKIVGSSSGLSDFGDGAAHQSVEDVAIMRAIPNMTVLTPCDGIETKKAVRAATKYHGPVYIRLNRNDLPDIYNEDIPFVIGEPTVLVGGDDVAIFAHGSMVSRALGAVESLKNQNISVKVINVSTLKPINKELLIKHCKDMKAVISVEEHSIIGGLGDIMCTVLSGIAMPFEKIGINDCFGQSAENYEDLLDYYGLTENEIVSTVEKKLRR